MFPSQTAYLTRDQGLDEEHGRGAETRVAYWREQGLLPFPEFSYAQRLQIENGLDYPPEGAPDHNNSAFIVDEAL